MCYKKIIRKKPCLYSSLYEKNKGENGSGAKNTEKNQCAHLYAFRVRMRATKLKLTIRNHTRRRHICYNTHVATRGGTRVPGDHLPLTHTIERAPELTTQHALSPPPSQPTETDTSRIKKN